MKTYEIPSLLRSTLDFPYRECPSPTGAISSCCNISTASSLEPHFHVSLRAGLLLSIISKPIQPSERLQQPNLSGFP